jgi:hypothetical protein
MKRPHSIITTVCNGPEILWRSLSNRRTFLAVDNLGIKLEREINTRNSYYEHQYFTKD